MRNLIEKSSAETPKILRFVRLDGFDKQEFFLVKRGSMYYALYFSVSSGISLDIIVRGKSRSSVEAEFELAMENAVNQTGVGTGTHAGSPGTVGVATTKVDAVAKKHLAVFDHPIFGLDWGGDVRDAADDISSRSSQQFHKLLDFQVKNWKGSSSGINASKHRDWESFSEKVQQAVKKKYGTRIKLYRGIHGDQARDLIRGGALDVRKYSSWTSDYELAKAFRSGIGGRAGDSAWVIVSKVFSPRDVALAPVPLPGYGLDPQILMPLARDVQGSGDELIVHVSSKKIPSGKFKIVAKTRSKRFTEDARLVVLADRLLEICERT